MEKLEHTNEIIAKGIFPIHSFHLVFGEEQEYFRVADGFMPFTTKKYTWKAIMALSSLQQVGIDDFSVFFVETICCSREGEKEKVHPVHICLLYSSHSIMGRMHNAHISVRIICHFSEDMEHCLFSQQMTLNKMQGTFDTSFYYSF